MNGQYGRFRNWWLLPLLLALVLVVPGAARAEAVTITSPVEMVMMSCTEEPVSLTGTQHHTMHLDIDNDKLHFVDIYKFSLTGFGLASSVKYQGEFQGTHEENGRFTPLDGGVAPYEVTIESTMVLIRQGESALFAGDDLYVKTVSHLTINANGTVIPRDATFKALCR